jgi:hypothetical protein
VSWATPDRRRSRRAGSAATGEPDPGADPDEVDPLVGEAAGDAAGLDVAATDGGATVATGADGDGVGPVFPQATAASATRMAAPSRSLNPAADPDRCSAG